MYVYARRGWWDRYTDTMGLLLVVMVYTANIHDSKAAQEVLRILKGKFNSLTTIFADGEYKGELIEKDKNHFSWIISIVLRTDKTINFEVLPKRWVVERTFAWFESYRRLSKDNEYKTDTSETMIQLAIVKLMLDRISK